MVFRSLWLLLFEPVLLQTSQRRHSGITGVTLAAALVAIQVGAAVRAQALAIAAANDLHGYGQQYLFREHIRQEKAVAFEKGDLGVIQLQAKFFFPGYRLHW